MSYLAVFVFPAVIQHMFYDTFPKDVKKMIYSKRLVFLLDAFFSAICYQKQAETRLRAWPWESDKNKKGKA